MLICNSSSPTLLLKHPSPIRNKPLFFLTPNTAHTKNNYNTLPTRTPIPPFSRAFLDTPTYLAKPGVTPAGEAGSGLGTGARSNETTLC